MKRIEYVKCPLCALNMPLIAPKRMEKGLPASKKWADFDPKTTDFIQVREGGGKVGTGKIGRGRGKGYGFPLIDAFTLEEVCASHMNEYGGIVKDMKAALVKLVKDAKSLGILTDSDLK